MKPIGLAGIKFMYTNWMSPDTNANYIRSVIIEIIKNIFVILYIQVFGQNGWRLPVHLSSARFCTIFSGV